MDSPESIEIPHHFFHGTYFYYVKDRCIFAFHYVFHVYVMKEFHNFVPGHGPQTGRCVPSDRHQDRWPDLKETSDFTSSSSYSLSVCEIQSWCPVEDDRCEID